MFALRVAVFLTLAGATSALAQDQMSFSALQGAGFELKTSDPLTLEQSQRINPDSQSEAIVVTLQKGPQVAVCYFALLNWIYMNKESLANTTLCEVR